MTSILITFEESGAKGLHQELEDSKYRQETFKRATMKAQSQLDTMRRFIQDRELEADFAGFVLINRRAEHPGNVLHQFGFTFDRKKEEEKPPQPE